ncbi:MAG: alpha/beta hydrolase [Candidatus Kapabacteria bacterium]|nr:alpha/beta hydrolase [Candidatus Kapabacteria bacterium]
MKQELYIFSGLGADERVFQRLDFSGFSVTYIRWITPHSGETIEQYSTRLLEQITSMKPILIGLSFGGLIAIEVAKHIDTEQVILIASAKSKTEIPFYYRVAGLFGLHKLLPLAFLKHSNILTQWFFGARNMFDRQLLQQILKDTEPIFLKWAIDKVVRWTNRPVGKNVFHIHGTSDRILPVMFVSCNVRIKNGGHFMTLTHADELNLILLQQLSRKE